MSTPHKLAHDVSRNTNDIEGLYELLAGVDGKIVELKTGQETLETRVNDGFNALNKRLDVLFTHLGITTTEPGSTS